MSNSKKANGPYIPLTTVDIIKAFLGLGRNKSYSEEIKTKHTEGNWFIDANYKNEIVVAVKTEDSIPLICIIQNRGNSGTIKIEESKANAKLIAAAPELLDALCAVLRSYEAACPEKYYSDDNVVLADDVIKKAIV